MWIFMIISGFVADILRTKHILQTTNIRKVFNAIGQFTLVDTYVSYIYFILLLFNFYLSNALATLDRL